MTQTQTLRNAVDTWIGSDRPSDPHPKTTALRVDSTEAKALISFGIPFPLGTVILSATLKLYTKDSWGGASPTITVRRIANRYTNSKVTWIDDPGAVGASATESHASTGDADLWEFDVAEILQAVADGADFYGFMVTSSSTTERKFRSSDAASWRPVLEVTWTEGPDTPTTLTPDGTVVSTGTPILEMDYTDTTGDDDLASAQVQLKTTNTGWTRAGGFTSPTFDSGEVIQDEPGIVARVNLSATAYGGLANGSSIFWTGRVKDAQGEWSGWSDVASFERVDNIVVTITSPSSGTPTVEDFTPPTVWTVTGGTAEKHRVTVERLDTGETVYDSGEVGGTGVQETIADEDGEAVLTTGVGYLESVYVWDTEDRVGTYDDPAYVLATREFTVVPDGTLDSVTALTTTVETPVPGVTVGFTRAVGAPDFFTFHLDGEVYKANVEAGDVLVSGDDYEFTFTGLRPGSLHTFGVSAIVDGVSSDVETITAQVHVTGYWLVDPDDRTRHLFLADTAPSDHVATEDGVTLRPLGATKAVRFTQAVRDYDGRMRGLLLEGQGGKTILEWVEAVEDLRSTPGRVLWLIGGTEALKVVIGDLNVRPTGDSRPTRREVTFGYWSRKKPRVPAVV